MSALVINLGPAATTPGPVHKAVNHSLPLSAAMKHRYVSRSIEERKYVPPLAAPVTRAAPPRPEVPTAAPAPAPRRKIMVKIVRVVLVVALVVAATIVAIKFIK